MTRGGHREGAGRPKKYDALVTRAVKIRPDQDAALVELGKKHENKVSGVVRDAIDEYLREARMREHLVYTAVGSDDGTITGTILEICQWAYDTCQEATIQDEYGAPLYYVDSRGAYRSAAEPSGNPG